MENKNGTDKQSQGSNRPHPAPTHLTPPVFYGNLLPSCPVVFPQTVKDLAEVLGRERTLFLIGQLPVCFVQEKRWNGGRRGGKGSRRVILYVPKRLKPDHRLVMILGWNDAQRLVDAFGGEIINPPTLHDVVYRPFRDAAIEQLSKTIPAAMLAEWFGVSKSSIKPAPQEELAAANDNTSRLGSRTG